MNEVSGASQQIGMALLAAVVQCQRWLSDCVEYAYYGELFSRTRWADVLSIDEIDDTVRLTLGVDARWESVDAPTAINDVEYRISLEVSDSGFRVRSSMEARLQVAIGEYPPGNHVLRDGRSEVLPFDEALAQLKAQAADYRDRDLLRERPVPGDRLGSPVTIQEKEFGGSPEQLVMGLLARLERSRRDLGRRAESLRAGPEFRGKTLSYSDLDVRGGNGPPRIQATAGMRALPSEGNGINDLEFFVIVEVAPMCFCVAAVVCVDLEQAMGTLPAGEHAFYEYRSEVVTFDEAMAEAEAQAAAVAALDPYCTALGLGVEVTDLGGGHRAEIIPGPTGVQEPKTDPYRRF